MAIQLDHMILAVNDRKKSVEFYGKWLPITVMLQAQHPNVAIRRKMATCAKW
jgi:hypothetical protein